MAQAVSRRSLTAEIRLQSRVILFGICGGCSGIENFLFQSISIISLLGSLHQRSTLLGSSNNEAL